MSFVLHCSRDPEHSASDGDYQCPVCAARLEISYADTAERARAEVGAPPERLPGVWRYRDLLPVTERTPIVSLGEGQTPLQECDRLRREIGVARLFVKNETLNPTGSFKDRSMAVGVAKAVEHGGVAAAVTSAGNAGAAAAAYAARAGLPLYVFVHRQAPRERIVQTSLYGAQVILAGETSTDTVALLDEARTRFGWQLLTTALRYNPYQGEGPKTIAYELAEQTDYDLPEWVVVPMGGGGLLAAIWKGLRELELAGTVGRLPRLIGVQPAGCAAIVRAFEDELPASDIPAWGEVTTVAASIADPIPLDGETALQAIRDSGGLAVSVGDGEMLEAEALLARLEGVYAEPAGASTVAALKALSSRGAIPEGATVALVVTGSGFKDLQSAARVAPPPIEIECSLGALERVLARR